MLAVGDRAAPLHDVLFGISGISQQEVCEAAGTTESKKGGELAGAVVAAAAFGGAAAQGHRPGIEDEHRCKRRRLRGKQNPGAERAAQAGDITDEGGDRGGLASRSGSDALNSRMRVSGGPSRSITFDLHSVAVYERDGHVLRGCHAGADGSRVGSLAQRGEGLAERDRGRGRPPDA